MSQRCWESEIDKTRDVPEQIPLERRTCEWSIRWKTRKSSEECHRWKLPDLESVFLKITFYIKFLRWKKINNKDLFPLGMSSCLLLRCNSSWQNSHKITRHISLCVFNICRECVCVCVQVCGSVCFISPPPPPRSHKQAAHCVSLPHNSNLFNQFSANKVVTRR